MKVRYAIARTMLSLLLLLPGAAFAQSTSQSTSQTLALSWFYTPDGSTGIVSVIRQGNPPTTQLFYSTCVETEQPVCQEGTGPIPNSAFLGNVSTNLKPGGNSNLTLYADTTGAGFSNWLCITPNYDTATCGSTAPATGGIIQVSWVKTNTWARITTAADTLYALGKVAQSASSGWWGFSATMRGTFMGTTVNTVGITTGEMELQTGSATAGSATIQSLAQRFAKGRKAK
jgi:hypothetical protein